LYALERSATRLGLPAAATFAVLSRNRLATTRTDQDLASELWNQHHDEFDLLDEDGRRDIEEHYARDRGATLVRETFGIDTAEVDRANERLGRASVAELRGHLTSVAAYAAEVLAGEGRGTEP
jgi:hypothetical protein